MGDPRLLLLPPPQVARTIAGLSNWAYGVADDEVWVHLYGSNKLNTKLPDNTKVSLKQTTRYPWDGHITITFDNTPEKPLALKTRIPAWAYGATIRVNGKASETIAKPGSYATVKRKWSAGDKVQLDLPMKVHLLEAHPKLTELNNAVAVTRGPIVYCLELPENKNGKQIWNNGLYLPQNPTFKTSFDKNRFGGITVLNTIALNEKQKTDTLPTPQTTPNWKNKLYRPYKPASPTPTQTPTVKTELIPYYAWANRGTSYMQVWIPLAK